LTEPEPFETCHDDQQIKKKDIPKMTTNRAIKWQSTFDSQKKQVYDSKGKFERFLKMCNIYVAQGHFET
jgi:hypothetical protein